VKGMMSIFAADTLAEDVLPLHKAGAPLAELDLPDALHRLVTGHPELLNPPVGDLRQRIRQAVESGDDAAFKATLTPGADYPLDW
jgi:hypothetical protein